MTPIEIAREMERLRPFLRELLAVDNARQRVMLGCSIEEQDPPDATIDNVILAVLTESKAQDVQQN
jgi:hypothetical protein